MKKLVLLIGILAILQVSVAQQWKSYLPKTKSDNYTFFDYQKAFYKYCDDYIKEHPDIKSFDGEEGSGIPGYMQFKRWEWYWKSRVDNVTGEFPKVTAWEVWQDYKKTLPNQGKSSKSQTGNWESMGPANLDAYDDGASQESGTGRLSCIEFDPNDNNHFWVGAPAGGVWETTDGGSSWTCLTDANPILGVSDIAIPVDYDRNTNPVIYIATGDRDAVDDPSIGILKSTDGGATWEQTGLTFSASANARSSRVICDPNDANTIIAATTSGVYKSTDGGNTWTVKQGGSFIDMDLIPGTSTLIATTIGFGPDAYRSTDMGETWAQVFSGDVDNEYRCDVAVASNDANRVYLITDYAATESIYGIYKSTDGGETFTQVYDGLTQTNIYGWGTNDDENDGGQGWYDVAFAVSNTDADVVYVGGVNGWISQDGCSSFEVCNGWASYVGADVVHADHHNAYFRPSDNRLFDVNDGGIYYCDNVTQGDESDWTSITDGIVTGQIYDIGISQDTEGTIVAGFQDNGTKLITPTSSPEWNIVKDGDGMCCAIDPSNTDTQWGTYTYLQVDQTTNLWGSASSIRSGGGAQWAGPLEADPQGGATVYIGTDGVERYPKAKSSGKPGGGGGSTWDDLSGTLDGTNYLSALDIFNDGTDLVIWTASPAGCWRSDPITTVPGDFYAVDGLPANQVTDIAIDEDDYNHVYVCFGGYDNINVYETTDAGATWTDISSGLPPVPAGAIVINEQNTTDNEVYVGTDAGIYVKLGEAPWQLYSTGMPFVSITDLEFYYDSNPDNTYLYAATYGRGVWRTDCYDPPAFDATISEIIEPDVEYCDLGSYTPQVVLSNIGSTALTSADVSYSIDGGTAVTESWSGNLAQGQSAVFTFSSSTTLTYGAHTITATVSNPNGTSPDDNPDNDSMSKDYDVWEIAMPYTQDFDAFPLGGNTNSYGGGTVALSECWVNETGDDMDWSVNTGPSPSGGTGPSGDHTSGTGTYIYTETSNGNNGKTARVSSPTIDLTDYTDCQVTFWYHMYSDGNTMGTLTVDLYYNGAVHNDVSVDWDGTVATSISGDQGDLWHKATVDISAADGANDFVLTFDALTGSDYQGDMAIDDFSVTGTDNSGGTTAINWTGSVDTDWQNTGNWDSGAIPVASDDVVISGSLSNYPVIDDGISTIAVCNNLTIESGATLTIESGGYMTVSGSITNNAGTGGLIIKSDDNGTGSLIQNTSGGVDATVYRKLSSTSRQWHMISSPIDAAPLSVFTSTDYLFAYDESANDYWTGASFDDGSENPWVSPSGNLVTAQGYIYNYVDETLTFTGQLNDNTSTSSINITYTDNGGTAPNGEDYNDFDGWVLLGNPYTSAIDWDNAAVDHASANIDDAIYIYDDINHNYTSYVSGTGTNGGTQYIPAMQGFFVKANASGTFNIGSAALVHNSQAFWKDYKTPENFIRLQISANGYTDETIIKFDENATNEVDNGMDAYKLFTMDVDVPQIYTESPGYGTDYSINTLPVPSYGSISIPLKVEQTDGDYTVSVTEFNFNDIQVYLRDNLKNTLTEISINDEITFTSDDSDKGDRFELVFEKSSSDVVLAQSTSIKLYPNPANGLFYLSVGNDVNNYNVEVVNITGQKIFEKEFTGKGVKELNLTNIPSGIYFVKIGFPDDSSITEKIVIE